MNDRVSEWNGLPAEGFQRVRVRSFFGMSNEWLKATHDFTKLQSGDHLSEYEITGKITRQVQRELSND